MRCRCYACTNHWHCTLNATLHCLRRHYTMAACIAGRQGLPSAEQPQPRLACSATRSEGSPSSDAMAVARM